MTSNPQGRARWVGRFLIALLGLFASPTVQPSTVDDRGEAQWEEACGSWYSNAGQTFGPWQVEGDQRCPWMTDWTLPDYETGSRFITAGKCMEWLVSSPGRSGAQRCFTAVPAVLGHDDSEICTGTLVAPGIVLTAKHCHAERVVFTEDLGDDVDHTDATAWVTRRVPHPDQRVDVALLVLDRAPAHAPVLWPTTRGDPPTAGLMPFPMADPSAATAVIAVFGANNVTGVEDPMKKYDEADKRRESLVAVPQDWGCTAATAEGWRCRPGLELVATAARVGSNADSCPGGSGGPLLEPVGNGWRVIGVVSRGLPGSTNACGEGGIYVRVDAISGWLVQTIPRLLTLVPRR